jgi:DNA-binding response OmpR family regulator
MSARLPLTVFVCDDALPVCDRLAQLLVTIPSITLDGCARTLAAGRTAIFARRPEVVILDLNFPDGHGLDLVRALRAAGLDTIVIINSVEPAAVWHELGVGAGVDFYLEKSTPVDRLLDLVEGLATCRTLLRRHQHQLRELRVANRPPEDSVVGG